VGSDENELQRLRAAALRNAESILIVRRRAEAELLAARDALEKKTLELEEQREWFAVTLSSIGDAVITTDTDAAVTYLNPVAEALTGWSLAEARGRPLEEVFRIINETTGEPAGNPVRLALKEGRTLELANHTALIRRDGTTVAIEDSAAPIRKGDGQISGAVMVFHDVTRRRRAEYAMREASERLQLALAAGALGDWSWDASTDLVSFGHGGAEIFGLPARAQITWQEMQSNLLPEDAAAAAAAVERALAEHSDYNMEYRIRRPSGERCWIAARGRGVYSETGAVLGMLGLVQDITTRRQSEEVRAHLAAVVEGSDDAILTKTLEGTIASWNRGAERIFGYTAGEVVGRSVTILIPDDHLDEEATILARIRRGERIDHYETVRVRKDGTRFDVSLSVSPLRDSSGTIIGASKIARDITERKNMEAALRESDRRKDEFLATLAHELRNPLAPIRQAALISQAPNATEAQKQWSHEVISRQVRNMALLLDDLLDLSRVSSGTLELRTENIQLAEIVEAAVETARPLIDAKRHALVIELPDQPVLFAADPLRLAQVFSNLLTNAAKYTDPEGCIRLHAASDGELITIAVADSGIGISGDALERVFQMFSQVKSAQDRSEGGLGIGLALTKGIVALHGGTIEARSAGPGRGSEFIVRLPRRGLQEAPIPVPTISDSPNAVRRCVLIADDNRDAAESLAILLRMEGHDVTVVHDGRNALSACRSINPDVALLDIGMPELNGYEVAQQVRQSANGSRPTLIAVTGWGQASDKARALAAGFDHHFTKPVEPDVIAALLRPQAT
jgi:PAS domain S-box-containing protein